MTEIVIMGWDRETEDHLGRNASAVVYVRVNGGKEKALSKSALWSTITSVLPERSLQDEEEHTLQTNGRQESQ